MCRVLVVDDNKDICDLIPRVLDRHEVEAVNSLKSARQMIREYRPSLILLDLELGDGSGRQLLEEALTESPIVITTAAALTEDEEADLIEKGATTVLRKPFGVRKLRAITDRLNSLHPAGGEVGYMAARLNSSTTALAKAHELLKQHARERGYARRQERLAAG